MEMLGQGTFGQVAACYSEATGRTVAVKVIKNSPAYYHQARVEVGILQLLNGRCDPDDRHHLVRLHDAFLHRRHLCLSFERLGLNLFELLKRNGFRGLSVGLLRLFLTQVRVWCVLCFVCLCCGRGRVSTARFGTPTAQI